MRIEKRRWDDVIVLTFIGEFDAFNLETFSAKIDTLIETGYTKLCFNLRLLTFINSAALGYLIRTKKMVEERGGNLVLVQPSKFVKKTLLTLGLDELFKIFDADVDAIGFFHSGAEETAIDLKSLPVETDDKLIGAGAILFRPIGESGGEAAPPTRGAIHAVGRILNLYKDGPVFRWRIPDPGTEAAGTGITTENFDQRIHEGTPLRIKFRQPLAVKSHFFEAEARIKSVEKAMEEGGVEEATLSLEYTSMDPDDREVLDRYVDDLDEFRGETR
jgi:anti-anti-sigma factor